MERDLIIYNNKIYEDVELNEFDGLVITANITNTKDLDEVDFHGMKFIYHNVIRVNKAKLLYLDYGGKVLNEVKLDTQIIEDYLISNMVGL